MTEPKTRYSWITAHDDRTEHSVSDDAYEASVAGVFGALCGIEFLAASMDIGPDSRCPACVGFVHARKTMRGLHQRMADERRPAWLSWLSCRGSRSRGRHAA